jgi:hypothetical protein
LRRAGSDDAVSGVGAGESRTPGVQVQYRPECPAIFEGWAHNPDGSTSIYFGYINRNYVETPSVPVGAENRIEPGDQDRGQATLFNARIHRMAFKVVVPKDWGKKELMWTVTPMFCANRERR